MKNELLKSLGYSDEYINQIENYKNTKGPDFSSEVEKLNLTVSDSVNIFVKEDPKTSLTSLHITL